MSKQPSTFILTFPEDFLWGVSSTSEMMVRSCDNDWSHWKALGREALAYASQHGHPLPSSERQEWIELLTQLSVNAVIISIDWSQIEPHPGVVDRQALEDHAATLRALKSHNIKVMLALHHLTHPRWFHQHSPWHSSKSKDVFLRMLDAVFPVLAPFVDFWITFREPNILLTGAFLEGLIPPGFTDVQKALLAFRNLLETHAQVFERLKSLQERSGYSAPVGMSIHWTHFSPHRPINPLDHIKRSQIHHLFNLSFVEGIQTGKMRLKLPGYRQVFSIPFVQDTLEFLGVSYFSRIKTRFSFRNRYHCEFRPSNDKTTTAGLGWESFPQGLSELFATLKRTSLPIFLTGNATGDQHDSAQVHFVHQHLRVVYDAVAQGIPVKGYFYGSPWFAGKGMDDRMSQFALTKIDDHSGRPILRESGHFFSGIARTYKMFSRVVT